MIDLMPYWPTHEHIKECIRTEAEELAEHTLLAVHEPMRLLRRGLDGTKKKSDEDLLNDFLQVERPIPIIGRSGVGKSHLLRWLHAKLKVHPDATGWHIVRIPKNASLRQVLELLLAGLEGETFDQARQRVKTVGEQLNTHEVAQLLLTFMGQQLSRLYQEAQEEIERYQKLGAQPKENEAKDIKTIARHCGDAGLPSLINDTHFQEFLLAKEHCVYQFAKRLTSGASDEELGDYDYQFHAKDLDFNYNLNDLAIQGRKYVQTQQLNTNENKRQEAVDMLNLVLGEATRTAFSQLFQFGGSNFQELFKQIRKDLFAKEQTLVVLVEDMAAISAIEDVLIDSLMEENLYEGIETMCSLRSAIAVTDGYPGYLRRRDTLRTRATAEWWIEEVQGDESEQVMQERVVDFCSRYINAARHGSAALEESWEKKEKKGWPPVWENEDIDRQHLDAFGRASTNISLYPLSHRAVRALMHANCKDDKGQLRFNPRQVINQILLKVLREWRTDAERGQFPPKHISEASVPVNLKTDLAHLGLKDTGRCETLAAIWGYGVDNLNDLKDMLSADIALSFGLEDLAKHLRNGVVHIPNPSEDDGEGKGSKPEQSTEKPPVDPSEEKLKALMTEVDQWCQYNKELGQNEARILRNVLAEMYEIYASKEWAGVGALPPIRKATFQKILIPLAHGNTAGSVVEFCSEKIFKDRHKSVLFHATARSFLRYGHFNPQSGEKRGWNYPGGNEDFLRYQNFAASWVPGVLQALRDHERKKVNDLIGKHVAAARTLAIFRDSDSHRKRLNRLLESQQSLAKTLPVPACDTVLRERNKQLEQWDKLQGEWLNLLSSNDHCLEGDLAIQALKQALQQPLPNSIRSFVNQSLGELRAETECANWLSAFTDADSYIRVLHSLDQLIKKLKTNGKYPPKNDSIVTSRTLSGKVKAQIESNNFGQIQKIKQFCENNDVERQWLIINELDGDKIKPLVELFHRWQEVFNSAYSILQNENSMWGSEQVTKAKESIDKTLSSLHSILKEVAEVANDNS